jgi:hypothetical protein
MNRNFDLIPAPSRNAILYLRLPVRSAILQLAIRLRASAAGVLAAASEADAEPTLDGVLGREGPWLALDGVDGAPAVFAAARVAEALLAALRGVRGLSRRRAGRFNVRPSYKLPRRLK